MRIAIFILVLTFTVKGISQNVPASDDQIAKDYKWLESRTILAEDEVDDVVDLWNYYSKIHPDTAKMVADLGVTLVDKGENEKSYARMAVLRAMSLMKEGDYKETENELREVMEIGKRLDDNQLQALASNQLGRLYTQKDDLSAAIQYYLKAASTYNRLEDTVGLFNVYYNIGGIYYKLNMWDKTEEYVEKAGRLAENLSDSYKERIYAGKSVIYYQIGDAYADRADTMLTGGETYMDSMQYYVDKSLENAHLSIELLKRSGNTQRLAGALNNLTNTYIYLSELDKAQKIADKAHQISAESNNMNAMGQSTYNLANLYMMKGIPDKGLEYALKSLAIAEKSGNASRERRANNILFGIYKNTKNYERALHHLTRYNDLQREAENKRNKQLVVEAETRYQSTEKEKQLLEQQNNIQLLEIEQSRVEKQRNYIMGGGLLLGLLTLFGFKANKLKKERNDKKAFAEALIFAQEEERKRIARELHDGIGQSLLLIKKQMTHTHEVTTENQKMISDTLEEVRSISRDLHPFQLDKFGITEAIEENLEKINASTQLFISKEIGNIDKLLSTRSEVHLFRIIQEGFTNIVKHADATAAKLQISRHPNAIEIKIMDNGKGFDHELAVIKSNSLGLKTMYERISALNGKLKISRNIPSGSLLEITIPVPN